MTDPRGGRRADRPTRPYRRPGGELVVQPPRFVPMSAEDEQVALAALAELLAPLFAPRGTSADAPLDG